MIKKLFILFKKSNQEQKKIELMKDQILQYETEITVLAELIHAKEKKYARWEKALEVITHSIHGKKWYATVDGQAYAIALIALKGYGEAVRIVISNTEKENKENLRTTMIQINKALEQGTSLKYNYYFQTRKKYKASV